MANELLSAAQAENLEWIDRAIVELEARVESRFRQSLPALLRSIQGLFGGPDRELTSDELSQARQIIEALYVPALPEQFWPFLKERLDFYSAEPIKEVGE